MTVKARLLIAILGLCCFLGTAQPASAAAPAWLPIAATGPTVMPPTQSEVQNLWVDAESGSYSLKATTASATVTTVNNQANVTVTAAGFGSFKVGDVVTITPRNPNLPAGTTIVSCAPSCAAPTTITLSNKTTGLSQNGPNRKLTVEGTTAPISFNAPASGASSVSSSLEAVLGSGAVTVTGGPGGLGGAVPYAISFGGVFANTDVPMIVTDATALVGGGQSATVAPIVPGGPGTTTLVVYSQNVGGAESHGSLTLTVKLPSGVTTTKTPVGGEGSNFEPWTCSTGAGQTEFTCTSVVGAKVPPSNFAHSVVAEITAAPGIESGLITFEMSGGGAAAAGGSLPLTIGSVPAPPGIQSINAGAYDSNGRLDTRAGAHPYSASTAILANTKRAPNGSVVVVGDFRDIVVDLPTGFLGNPIAVPQCPEATQDLKCPFETMVGNVIPLLKFGTSRGASTEYGESAVFNTEAPYGYPGKFRFNVKGLVPLNAIGTLRSDGDYGLTVASLNTPQIKPVVGAFFTFWGTPADKSHDSARCNQETLVTVCGPGAEGDPTAFVTNATNCAEQASIAAANGGKLPMHVSNTVWQRPGEVNDLHVGIPPVTGCDKLKFEADFTFEPSSTVADSPASFKTSLTVPSDGLTDPRKRMTPEIKDAVVTLPEGVVLNASGADGLEACSLAQIGYRGNSFSMPNPIRFTRDAQTCPEASKIGTGELKTALLADPLHGALYLAAQGDGNPYGSLFAIYLVIEDPRHGIFIKLPGKVEPDEKTGQMKVTFQNLPQLPFTRLDLNLKGGNRSALASPTTCGNYVTTATNTPWSYPESGPPTVSANGFDINQGPNGLPCASTPQQRPFDLGWSAGAESTKAGADGPFHFRIQRPDGSQELTNLELTTPKGLSASLRGIPYCSTAQIQAAEQRTGKEELASSSCPAASKVGTLTTGAGSGPSPFYVSGNLYLAGPYKGAPISVVAVTPAVAGPFDLGNVVVRAAAHINRTTAQVTAKSDPIPQILKGVVLRIKDVQIKLDRKDWTINPTSCEASTVNLKASGNSGASTEKSARFQVGGCKDLSFGPKLSAHLTGGTKRGAHPAFTATVDFPAGQANTKDVQVTLPHSEFLDQAHINTICTRVQAAANACPQGAIYGFAEAESPLIDGKLTGPVFLKSSSHQLPDLAIALKGPDHQPVEVEFQGRIDSIKAQIRNTIEGLPDVPVSKFTLKMKGGKKGLLVNSRNLCSGKVTKMTVKMTGQNNKQSESRPPLTRKCKGAGKASKQKKAKRVAAKSSSLGALLSAW